MARFDLKKAKQKADAEAPLSSGYYRAVIVQLAEVGLQRDFDPTREPSEKFGIVFELPYGALLAKISKLSTHASSVLGQVLAVVDRDVDELPGLLGCRLDLEVVENGRYPKIVGYYANEDGMADNPVDFDAKTKPVFYTVDEPDPATVKVLHRDLRQAISNRIRERGGDDGE